MLQRGAAPGDESEGSSCIMIKMLLLAHSLAVPVATLPCCWGCCCALQLLLCWHFTRWCCAAAFCAALFPLLPCCSAALLCAPSDGP